MPRRLVYGSFTGKPEESLTTLWFCQATWQFRNRTDGETTLSRMNFSGYVGPVTIFSLCSLLRVV